MCFFSNWIAVYRNRIVPSVKHRYWDRHTWPQALNRLHLNIRHVWERAFQIQVLYPAPALFNQLPLSIRDSPTSRCTLFILNKAIIQCSPSTINKPMNSPWDLVISQVQKSFLANLRCYAITEFTSVLKRFSNYEIKGLKLKQKGRNLGDV